MTLLEKIQTIVCEYGAEAMAQELGKPYKTLMRELNPNDEGAKLGLMTFLQILHISNNYSPLDMIAMKFRKVLFDIPMSQINPAEVFARLSCVLRNMGDFIRKVGKISCLTSEGNIAIVEKEKCILNKQGHDLLQALAALLACIEK